MSEDPRTSLVSGNPDAVDAYREMEIPGRSQVSAYSDETGKTYENWDALVGAEANGIAVIALLTNGKKTWPWVHGPYETKRLADLARNRIRRQIKKEIEERGSGVTLVGCYSRPIWKEDPS